MCIQEMSTVVDQRKTCTLTVLTNYKCHEENNVAVFEKITLFTLIGSARAKLQLWPCFADHLNRLVFMSLTLCSYPESFATSE